MSFNLEFQDLKWTYIKTRKSTAGILNSPIPRSRVLRDKLIVP